jgi:hypothetical protein
MPWVEGCAASEDTRSPDEIAEYAIRLLLKNAPIQGLFVGTR